LDLIATLTGFSWNIVEATHCMLACFSAAWQQKDIIDDNNNHNNDDNIIIM
jgi:hypothetical protein